MTGTQATPTRPAPTLVPSAGRDEPVAAAPGNGVALLRHSLGEVLRRERQRQGRTLREVSSGALVSLGYLSEVERGQKEASSELLASICGALEVPVAYVLHEVSVDLARAEGVPLPDSLPEAVVGLRATRVDRVGDVVAAA